MTEPEPNWTDPNYWNAQACASLLYQAAASGQGYFGPGFFLLLWFDFLFPYLPTEVLYLNFGNPGQKLMPSSYFFYVIFISRF